VNIPVHLAATLAAAVDHGSLDAAATALHITPPAVSQRIRQLEHVTGQVLLIRSRPVQATAAGLAVLRFARQVEHLDSVTRQELGLHGRSVSIPIGVNADSLATWLLAPLTKLASSSSITFDLHRDDQEHTLELLERGVVLAAVTSQPEPVPGCSVRPLGAITYRAAASASYARRWLAGGPTPSALESAPLVDFDRRDELQSLWLKAMGADPAAPPRHRIPSTSDMTHAIRMGLGWGMVITIEGHDHSAGLQLLGGEPVAVPLYWQQWRASSDLLDSVATHIEEAARPLRASR
jgi:LysR family transcriptional regulator (chromosome initiation inhibitor)